MNRKILHTCLLSILLLSLANCSKTPSSQPRLIFADNSCTYAGPNQLPPDFTLTWQVENTSHPGAIVLIVTLEPGKTLKDLASIPAEDPPPTWVNKLVYDTATQPGTFTKAVNLAEVAAYHGEPIYFACFYTDLPIAIGAAGSVIIRR